MSSVLKKMTERKPIATYNAYVDEVIKEKLLISNEIMRDPHAAMENSEKKPSASKLA